ncbi:MAG: PEGA domain-containing protein [Candidatus Moranbacteria bacterium]|nr:PEGA domain-containing protein [Candidatus Moranbacteria bacterium]
MLDLLSKDVSVTRKILSFLALIVFLLSSVFAIFLAFGYRFNFDTRIFIYSGTIMVKTTPQNVDIYLDDKKIQKKSYDIINNSYNIHGLKPGEYNLRIAKQGYKEWKKTIQVHSGIATEFWNIVLAPEKLEKERLDIVDPTFYKVAEGGEKILFANRRNGPLNIYLYSSKKENAFLIYEESPNKKNTVSIEFVEFSPDKDQALLLLKEQDFLKYYLANFSILEKDNSDKNGLIYLNPLFLNIFEQKNILKEAKNQQDKDLLNNNQDSTEFVFNFSYEKKQNKIEQDDKNSTQNPLEENILELTKFKWLDNENFYFLDKDKNLYLSDLNEQKTKLILENIRGYEVSQGNIYFIKSPNNLVFKSNSLGKDIKQITENLIDQDMKDPSYKITIYDDDRLAIRNNDNQLYLYNNNDSEYQIFKKISDNIKGVQFSDDGKKLLYFNEDKIKIYYLREWEVQPKNKVGNDKTVFVQKKERIRDAMWFKDYQHVLYNTQDQVNIVEIDLRDSVNNQNVLKTQVSNPGFSYDTSAEKLFFLDQSDVFIQLFSADFPPEK